MSLLIEGMKLTKSCEDCIHSDVCASYFIASEDFELCNVERMANDCDDFIKRIQSADVGKKDMPLTTALIILNNLNTTERIDVDREELCPPRKNRQKTYAKNRMKRMTNII